MVSLLLPVIYLAFISLGLPDALLGAAWPSMYLGLGAGLSWAGMISMIISAGTVVSSLASDALTARLGPGRVTAISVGTTAAALFGFSTCTAFWQLCLWAVPYGLGASGGPVIMGWALAHSGWQSGYRIISVLQVVLTAIIIFSLPLWKKPGEETGEEIAREHRTLPQLMRVPGVPEVMAMFACYSVVETTAGMWASSYCTLQRGIDAGTAASWASLFYVGITVGRFLSGFIAMKLNDHQMINLGFVLVALGILPILLPLGSAALVTGLVTVGLGCAPIYPSIIHETPLNFGRNLSMALTGVQMAAAYVGNVVFPPLFGLLAQYISISLYPWYLLAALVLMAIMSRALHRKTAAKRAANGY